MHSTYRSSSSSWNPFRTEEAWCFVSTLELLARDDEAIHQPRDSIICRGMNGNQRRSRLL
jgi:hypothetical protein